MKINKKILFPMLLLILIAVSLSGVSAVEDSTINNNAGDIPIASVSTNSDIRGSSSNTINLNPTGESNHSSYLQGIIDNCTGGETLNFGNYNYTNISVIVNKQLTFVGDGATIIGTTTPRDNIIKLVATGNDSSGSTFNGLTFIINAEREYGINLQSVSAISINNCKFYDQSTNNLKTGGVSLTGTNNVNITNCYFEGKHDYNETGTVALNVGSNTNNTNIENCVINNTWDAISSFQGAKNIKLINNLFTNNIYDMFFGGAVAYVTIKNNTFNRPVKQSLAMTKAQDNYRVEGNTFILNEGTNAIFIEQGNTAHGYATTVINITIEDNNFFAADGQDPTKIIAVLYHNTNASSPGMRVVGEFTIINNPTTGGITLFKFYEENETSGNVTIIQGETVDGVKNTTISGSDLVKKYKDPSVFTVQLKDSTGKVLANKKVKMSVNGRTYTQTTDINGFASLPIRLEPKTYSILVKFEGDSSYTASENTYTITVIKQFTFLSGSDFISNVKGKYYKVTLKDGDNKVIANAPVKFTVNGRTYVKMTDSRGVAGLEIGLPVGSYIIKVTYDGSSKYLGSSTANVIKRT